MLQDAPLLTLIYILVAIEDYILMKVFMPRVKLYITQWHKYQYCIYINVYIVAKVELYFNPFAATDIQYFGVLSNTPCCFTLLPCIRGSTILPVVSGLAWWVLMGRAEEAQWTFIYWSSLWLMKLKATYITSLSGSKLSFPGCFGSKIMLVQH